MLVSLSRFKMIVKSIYRVKTITLSINKSNIIIFLKNSLISNFFEITLLILCLKFVFGGGDVILILCTRSFFLPKPGWNSRFRNIEKLVLFIMHCWFKCPWSFLNNITLFNQIRLQNSSNTRILWWPIDSSTIRTQWRGLRLLPAPCCRVVDVGGSANPVMSHPARSVSPAVVFNPIIRSSFHQHGFREVSYVWRCGGLNKCKELDDVSLWRKLSHI